MCTHDNRTKGLSIFGLTVANDHFVNEFNEEWSYANQASLKSVAEIRHMHTINTERPWDGDKLVEFIK